MQESVKEQSQKKKKLGELEGGEWRGDINAPKQTRATVRGKGKKREEKRRNGDQGNRWIIEREDGKEKPRIIVAVMGEKTNPRTTRNTAFLTRR